MLELKKKTLEGTIWGAFERFSGQGIQFIVLIVMARLLTPKDYGLIGMVAIFTNIAQSLVDSGFSQALIRKQNRTNVDNSTTFYFNFVVAILIYACFYLIAPLVSDFYNEPELTALMRTISVVIIFNSLSVVQTALYTAKVDFKTQAKATISSAGISGVVGIYFAYRGNGAWALVYQQLTYASVNTILLWIFSSWTPSKVFSWKSFKELFSFGSRILGSGIINTLYRDSYQLVIGKFFAAESLGFYTRASHFAQFPSTNISGILQRVTFPVLCAVQDNREKLVDVYKKFIRVSTLIIFPLMMMLAGISNSMVSVVLGDKWQYTASLLIILCFSSMWYPVHHLNVNILQAIGRSDLTLKTEIYKKTVGIVILVTTLPFGIEAMCYGGILNSIVSLFINCYYVGKLLKYGFFQQMLDILPVLIISFFIFGVIYYIQYLIVNPLIHIIVGLIIGCTLCFTLCFILNIMAFKDIKSLIK